MPANPIDHFKSLFAYAPISLWEEDYSGIKQFFDDLRSRGITDLNKHFDKHPADIDACMKCIRVLHVNHETLGMFGANSEAELLANLEKTMLRADNSMYEEKAAHRRRTND